jgi:retron-type reverse transcriptase
MDISKFFDELDHELMLKALKHYTQERWVIMYVERWLKAGMVYEDEYLPRDQGTPQGGVISPLLANISLHWRLSHTGPMAIWILI